MFVLMMLSFEFWIFYNFKCHFIIYFIFYCSHTDSIKYKSIRGSANSSIQNTFANKYVFSCKDTDFIYDNDDSGNISIRLWSNVIIIKIRTLHVMQELSAQLMQNFFFAVPVSCLYFLLIFKYSKYRKLLIWNQIIW